jgi:hypothetical protein
MSLLKAIYQNPEVPGNNYPNYGPELKEKMKAVTRLYLESIKDLNDFDADALTCRLKDQFNRYADISKENLDAPK